jgi:hypothetical protein
MKAILILLSLLNISTTGASQHNKFSITWAYGLAGGGKPTITNINKEDAITQVRAKELINFFLEKTKIDFKCVYNGCQNRASVMSMYLTKAKIKHYKIWNFDPFKISIFNAQDALDVDDLLKLKKDKIYWDFHVAIAVLVKTESSKIDTLVFDPSFSSQPLEVNQWLRLQNSPKSHYTFLDPVWYNYVTIQPGLNWACGDKTEEIKIPGCFPYIITGDFYSYSSSNDSIVREELAVNEQITRVAYEVIYKMSEPQRSQISEFVSDYNRFKNLLQANDGLPQDHVFYKYFITYREYYKKSVAYWTEELNKLK